MIKSGIYIIKSSTTIRVYIGSTSNFDNRKWKHFNDLKENKHQYKFQNGYNKHKNFVFEVLEYVEDVSKLIEREQFYLDTLLFASEDNDKFDKLGYNLCRQAAHSTLGIKLTKEQSKKSTETRKRKLASGEIIPWNKGKTGCFSRKTLDLLSFRLTGKKRTDEQKANYSKTSKGRNKVKPSKIKGTKHTEEANKKQSLSRREGLKIRIICSFCNKDCDRSVYAQYHGDNCKLNPNRSQESLDKELDRNIKISIGITKKKLCQSEQLHK